jgi:hypothetical protein
MSLKSPGTLLSESYTFYKEHAALLVQIALVPVIVSAVFAFLTLAVGDKSMVEPLGLLGGLLGVVASMCATLALILTVAHGGAGKTVGEAYAQIKPLFLPYLLLGILSGLILLVGFLLFVIPGVILAVWFCFSYFTLALEGKRGVEALKASKEYVRGLWFDVFIRLLVLMMVTLLLIISGSIILGIVLGDSPVFNVLTDALSMLLSPFAIIYSYLMYVDVKKLKAHPPQEPVVTLA